MSERNEIRRAEAWLPGLGDWHWPGTRPTGEALAPPAWVPAVPPPLPDGPAIEPAWTRSSSRTVSPARLLLAAVLSAAAAAGVSIALTGSLPLAGVLSRSQAVAPAAFPRSEQAAASNTPLPPLTPVSRDSAGSAIESARFSSPTLGAEGSFLVYLPPGFDDAHRYPVLYLLHGQNGHATAFLEVGLQPKLDRLIARDDVPPMIAVMVQDRPTMNNWRDMGNRRSASYVIEVQQLVDRMLPTMADRDGRAIAGSSMGGFGAMHVALANPTRFSVVESWLGYFNHLEGELHADRAVIAGEGLHAFLYGATGDLAAEPWEDPAFAAQLRAAGADAQSAIYTGNHSLTTVAEHLQPMLLFAGRSLREQEARAASARLNRSALGLVPRLG